MLAQLMIRLIFFVMEVTGIAMVQQKPLSTQVNEN